jgi:hypothetical protein
MIILQEAARVNNRPLPPSLDKTLRQVSIKTIIWNVVPVGEKLTVTQTDKKFQETYGYFYYCVRNSAQVDPVSNRIHPAHVLKTIFLKTRFILIDLCFLIWNMNTDR